MIDGVRFAKELAICGFVYVYFETSRTKICSLVAPDSSSTNNIFSNGMSSNILGDSKFNLYLIYS